MVEIKEKERAIIEFTCIPEVTIEKAGQLYELGFTHLLEFLEFTLDPAAKEKGLLPVINHRILAHYLSLDDEAVPSTHFKCPFCMATVFADEEECEGCGALLLEEILEVDIEDVYDGLREMIDATLANPHAAKTFLEGKGIGEEDSAVTDMELAMKELEEPEPQQGGFTVSGLPPLENEKNYVLVISPLGEHEKERDTLFSDLKEFGAGDQLDFPVEGGNINNKQEEAVAQLFSDQIKGLDLNGLGVENFFILNIKIARFWEAKATITVEDNRHFLSSMDEIRTDDDILMAASRLLYDNELIKEIRKTGENFVMDVFSFNNDPISFLVVKQCLPVIKENPGISFRLVDVVVNTDYLESGSHNDLARLLLEWKDEA
jgi:hypothetical protein